MINCEQVRSVIYAYLDRELSRSEAKAILEHVQKCKHCFSELEFEKILKRLTRRALSRPSVGPSF